MTSSALRIPNQATEKTGTSPNILCKWAVCIFIQIIFLFTPPGFAGDKTLTVQKVLDGNSLKLSDGRKVHMIGVEAPEIQNSLQNQRLASSHRVELDILQVYGY